MHKQIIRIIDSNRNRAAEGIRVLEDIARMILNDDYLSKKFKEVRHKIINSVSVLNDSLVSQRDTEGDVGSYVEPIIEQSGLPSIIYANAKRAEEGLRVIEEMTKLPDLSKSLDSNIFKQLRFEVYNLEQELSSRIMRRDKSAHIKGVYAIVDTNIISLKDIIKTCESIIKGGAKVLQLRDKVSHKKELLETSIDLQNLCNENDALFIINDYLDIALAANTDGIHLGQGDIPVGIARKELPIDRIIGVSVQTVPQAIKAHNEGADYIAAGSVFPTKTKRDTTVIELDILKQIKNAVDLPLVAIGGINLENAQKVIATGVDSLAIISAILNSADIAEVTRQFVNKF